jgi:hypothetical protein
LTQSLTPSPPKGTTFSPIITVSIDYKQHLMDSTNVNADNLLQDYFINCLTGLLHTEVFEEFCILPAIEQSAATLVYLALTKLHSNLSACVPALQESIFSFKLSRIFDENVSFASSWLKAIIKTLRANDDIPSYTIDYILSGMATSQSTTFNNYISAVLADVSCTEPSTNSIHSILNKCCDKYRDLLQAGHWPMAQSKE